MCGLVFQHRSGLLHRWQKAVLHICLMCALNTYPDQKNDSKIPHSVIRGQANSIQSKHLFFSKIFLRFLEQSTITSGFYEFGSRKSEVISLYVFKSECFIWLHVSIKLGIIFIAIKMYSMPSNYNFSCIPYTELWPYEAKQPIRKRLQ